IAAKISSKGQQTLNMFGLFKRSAHPTLDKALLNQLYRYALSLCHDESQAHDLVQYSCEKVLTAKVEPTQIKPYMMKVIRHAFIDQYRRKQFELVKDDSEILETIEKESDVLKSLEDIAIDEQHVDWILSRVTPHEREQLYLWAVEGMSVQEIAEMTDTPKGTLLSRLNRLRKRITTEFNHLQDQEAQQ
ncbi:RNA polymerase sigma factor, partial [Vibrio nigripulchritudo]|uniref:RNA polymerase sigma factor n=1 Tax=Vibrio nigripulchritudo TaxID=28173 RepID=UPI000AC69AE6